MDLVVYQKKRRHNVGRVYVRENMKVFEGGKWSYFIIYMYETIKKDPTFFERHILKCKASTLSMLYLKTIV